MTQRPNVVLVVLDTARADVFEPWGGTPGTTPVMADLASAGHAPRVAVSPGPWTVPSHVSMFAGRDARHLGLGQAPGGSPLGVRGPLRDHALDLLPTVLREAGYDTRGASANAWLGAASGFDTGFGAFTSLHHERRAVPTDSSARGRLRWIASCVHPDSDDGANHGRRVIEDWMGAVTADRPFFWFVNLVECHSPYMPPAPYNSLGVTGRLRSATDVVRYQTFDAVLRTLLTEDEPSRRSARDMHRLYLDSIRLLDGWLDWLASTLESRGLADDTVLIVTSDHGELFGEDGRWGHGYTLADELVHVPFVARGPGVEAWPDLLSLTWLPSLIAGVTGVGARDAWQAAGDIAVSSFDRIAPPDHPRFGELGDKWRVTERGIGRVATSLTSATDGVHSVLVRGGDDGVVAADAVSWRGDPDQDTQRRLMAALEPSLDQLARNAAETDAYAPPTSVDDDDLREQLRLLGYME